MLAWLHAAFSHEAEVESYRETTEGVLSPLPEGRFWVAGDPDMTPADLQASPDGSIEA